MKRTDLIAIVLIGGAIVVLALYGFKVIGGDTSTYENFTTAIDNPQRTYHVVGTLDKSQEMIYNPLEDPNYFSFFMKDDEGRSHKVVYYDSKPNELEQSEKIVVVGKMNGQDFMAKDILQKCPSKYVDEEIELKGA